MKTWQWARGSRFSVSADDAGKELAKLENKLGRVPGSEDIVTAAKSKRSIIHGEFDWNDASAAHKYRIDRASEMRRSLLVYVVPEGKNEPTEAREYDYIDRPKPAGGVERVWRHTTELLADVDDRVLLLARAKREADSYRRRYAALRELAEVFEAMDRAFSEAG